MSVYQPTPRKSATKQAALANRLLANTSIAPHVLASTIEDPTIQRAVRGATAAESTTLAGLHIEAGTHFWFVASKFANRYYILLDDWTCSSSDERVTAACITKVQASRIRRAA